MRKFASLLPEERKEVFQELEILDDMCTLQSLVSDLNRAKEQADRDGWIDEDEAECLLETVD